jgi:hypothetical protein
MSDQILVDNFDKYSSNDILGTVWRPQAGTNAQIELVSSGDKMLKFNYAIGDGNPPYAGIQRDIDADYSATSILRFWLLPDGSNRDMIIILRAGTDYWRYDYPLTESTGTLVEIPVDEFVHQTGINPVDRANLTQISFSILPGDGGNGAGEMYFDDFAFALHTTTSVDEVKDFIQPDEFKLYANYPNPFNPITNIEYDVPYEAVVKIDIVNTLGQVVKTLINEVHIPGRHKLTFNSDYGSRRFSSGVYFIHFTSGSYFTTGKMILLK